MNKDFTDGQPLVEFKLESAFDAGPILQLQFPKPLASSFGSWLLNRTPYRMHHQDVLD